jgi:hypothetical protein
VGVENDDKGFVFSGKPDNPPSVDYSGLIHIIGDDGYDTRLNDIGDDRTSLSANWFKQRGRSHNDIKTLRNNLNTFFKTRAKSTSEQRLWTTYKDYIEWLLGDRNRYATNFLSLNARATNAYKSANNVAYLVNRFVNPNIAKFFMSKGIEIDADQFALSEMVQFIWRSAIRDSKEILLYMPSRRMRRLFKEWITNIDNGGKATC